MTTLDKVRSFIATNQLIKQGEKILAACSGGSDSLALVDMLQKISYELEFDLAVAHVDHMFRGEESAADAEYVKDFCHVRSLHCYNKAINVPEHLSKFGGSPEDAARKLRYQYLREISEAWGNAKIATGHHRDDQAETVLLHLFRGSGVSGLSGMQAKTDDIIRPLLILTKQEIEAYCQESELIPRLDYTNLQPEYLRNRIRLQIIPYLERELGVSVREPICRTAQIIADQKDYFDTVIDDIWPILAYEADNVTHVSIEKLTKQHVAVKRLIFRRLIEKIKGNLTGITFNHVEKLIEMAECWPVGSKLDLPEGWRAERGYEAVSISRKNDSKPGVQYNAVLAIPGETIIPQLGIRILAAVCNTAPQTLPPTTAVFDLSALHLPLYVRSRHLGDRFAPRGMLGEKKVKDFLIDKKVPRTIRDRVPIFCDSEGTILWLGGLRGSRHGQISRQTSEYLTLQIIRLQED